MTNEEIKELLRIFNDSGVGELEVQRGEDRLRIRRFTGEPLAPPGVTGRPATPAAALAPAAATPPEAAPKTGGIEPEDVLVKSPIVGTFYDAASPGAAPFVKVGDAVEPGQVLCIIESMKLMNEIECEVAGVIAAKLVENGQAVEYGEALYSIRPR